MSCLTDYRGVPYDNEVVVMQSLPSPLDLPNSTTQFPSSHKLGQILKNLFCILLIGLGCLFSKTIALAYPIINLKTPQCFIVDPIKEQYFISNANGEPGDRDNNGFISKLDQEGSLIDLHFIQGGNNNTILHSPNGLAIVDRTLYVADLDAIRGFDKATGKIITTISLSQYHVKELTDLIVDEKDQLFVLDTKGNAIYQIDTTNNHHVSLYLQDKSLESPRGLVVHPKTGKLLVVSLTNGTILEINQDRSVHEIISNSFFTGRFRNLSGIDFDQYGSMYISDLTAGKIWRIQPDQKMQVIAEFLISPISVRVDRKKHMILVPYLYANGAEINGLERPVNVGNRQKKRRTLSDYYLGGFGKGKSK